MLNPYPGLPQHSDDDSDGDVTDLEIGGGALTRTNQGIWASLPKYPFDDEEEVEYPDDGTTSIHEETEELYMDAENSEREDDPPPPQITWPHPLLECTSLRTVQGPLHQCPLLLPKGTCVIFFKKKPNLTLTIGGDREGIHRRRFVHPTFCPITHAHNTDPRGHNTLTLSRPPPCHRKWDGGRNEPFGLYGSVLHCICK